jgi:hypothetical protein
MGSDPIIVTYRAVASGIGGIAGIPDCGEINRKLIGATSKCIGMGAKAGASKDRRGE